jgi:hypothetical protein
MRLVNRVVTIAEFLPSASVPDDPDVTQTNSWLAKQVDVGQIVKIAKPGEAGIAQLPYDLCRQIRVFE